MEKCVFGTFEMLLDRVLLPMNLIRATLTVYAGLPKIILNFYLDRPMDKFFGGILGK